MQPRTVLELPTGYQETTFFRLTERRRMLVLNVAAVGLLVVNGVIFWGLLLIYHVFDAPLVIDSLPEKLPTWLGVLIVILVLPLHEWVHGLAIAYVGHKPRYGIKPLKGVLYATADKALFWRNQYILVALAPLVVISVITVTLALFFPAETAMWLMFAAIINATGAVGDIWMTWVTLRFAPDVLVQDEEDGMRIFSPLPFNDA